MPILGHKYSVGDKVMFLVDEETNEYGSGTITARYHIKGYPYYIIKVNDMPAIRRIEKNVQPVDDAEYEYVEFEDNEVPEEPEVIKFKLKPIKHNPFKQGDKIVIKDGDGWVKAIYLCPAKIRGEHFCTFVDYEYLRINNYRTIIVTANKIRKYDWKGD